ncbi:glycosyltransferase [Saccharothrix syringae]|uniref:Glycosyltransferase family 1 protein n=1 Tax=Saccharothrix syringae TaxID=103733 RepID=A0A5Q0GWB3_SACSY|nr:glycosyltransferase [Saccharothrix syringae]QFZ18238.1 glycosyltransferase family 1 protein [Saccharothrix syringae]
MRVVHVSQPVSAGVAAVVLDLACAQRDRGWEAVVVCPPGPLADRARAAGVEVREWPAGRWPGPAVVAESVRLRRVLRGLAPDVVHLHSSKAGLVGRLVVRGRRPTLFQPHLWSFQAVAGPVGRLSRRWERFAARWTHQLVCVSDDELEAGRAAGVRGDAEVVCNGVDTGRLRPTDRLAARWRLGLPDAPTAVCVGRLAFQKGQDLLLAAWPAVLERVPGARLVLVGDGPMGERWRAAGADPSVRWWGHDDVVGDFYAAADVVVLPSRAEGMALVPLEAMACGRSVVAFDVSGVRQGLGAAGAVLPVGDVDGLAAAIAARLADPVLADREGARGRRRVELLFDRRQVADQVATLVEKVVGRG